MHGLGAKASWPLSRFPRSVYWHYIYPYALHNVVLVHHVFHDLVAHSQKHLWCVVTLRTGIHVFLFDLRFSVFGKELENTIKDAHQSWYGKKKHGKMQFGRCWSKDIGLTHCFFDCTRWPLPMRQKRRKKWQSQNRNKNRLHPACRNV